MRAVEWKIGKVHKVYARRELRVSMCACGWVGACSCCVCCVEALALCSCEDSVVERPSGRVFGRGRPALGPG